MTVEVRCPNPDCGQTVEVAEEDLGKKGRCRLCNMRFTLTASGNESHGEKTRADSKPTEPGKAAHGKTIQRLGRFEIRERLGAGAFGAVYRAYDPQLDREVALKVPHAERLSSPKFVKRFLNEARASARLQHPYIVPVFDAGEDGDELYIASAFIEGQTLDEALRERKLDFRETARIVLQLADALAYAHKQGIIHRDVKPANIMLDKNDEPHLMDFGLARLETSEEKLTRDGGVLGTPAYMPPEQARGELEAVGPASDQYSLGATLYEMLTGDAPFSGPPDIVIFNVTQIEPTAPHVIEPSVPRDLSTICLKAMTKERLKRFDDCSELADDLRRWLADEPIKARHLGVMERMWRWCRRNRAATAAFVAITALLLISVGAAIWVNAERAEAERQREIAVEAERKKAEAQVENDRRRAESLVNAILTAPAELVPYVIDLVKPLKKHAIPFLRMMYDDSDLESSHRLHAALALAEFGTVEHRFLVNSVAEAAPRECSNIATALSHARIAARDSLREKLKEAKALHEWQHAARLAIVALHLQDESLAQELCQLRPDPVERTMFIETFSSWHGEIADLAKSAKRIDDGAFRSGLALGVGSVSEDEFTPEVQQAWQEILSEWYLREQDTGTHSAAGWALRKLKLQLPRIAESNQPSEGFDWHINSAGMTMLQVPAGKFVRKDSRPDAGEQTVRISRSFLLADREVSREEFQRFMEDPNYGGEKPDESKQRLAYLTQQTKRYPASHVSWYDAVMFCNWLSWKEQLSACYVHTGDKETYPDIYRRMVTRDAWRLLPDAKGYRLPSEAEWEYACRAASTTKFGSGDDGEPVGRYAVFSSNHPEVCGTKLPNGWGLFDLHGNLSEWCQDWSGFYSNRPRVIDPIGPKQGTRRVHRGGNYLFNLVICSSSSRGLYPPNTRNGIYGFRVARTYP